MLLKYWWYPPLLLCSPACVWLGVKCLSKEVGIGRCYQVIDLVYCPVLSVLSQILPKSHFMRTYVATGKNWEFCVRE